jgi:hypothetical protein
LAHGGALVDKETVDRLQGDMGELKEKVNFMM